MKEKKNIDRLFQERFKDFEATPDPKVWNNIQAELKKKQTDRKPFIIPLWYRVAGVAALLALIFWLGQPLFLSDNTNNNIVDAEEIKDANNTEDSKTSDKDTQDSDLQFVDLNSAENVSDETTSQDNVTSNNTSTQVIEATNRLEENSANNRSKNSSAENNTRITEANSAQLQQNTSNKNERLTTPVEQNSTQSDIANTTSNQNTENTQTNPATETQFQQSTSESNTTVVSENSSTTSNILREKENKETGEVAETNNTKSLLEEAQKQTEETLKETTDVALEDPEKIRKWEVNSFAAPVYYDGFGDGSTIDSKFADNNTETDVSLAYGVNVAYAISDRLKIRTGVGKVTHSFTTNEVAFGATTSSLAVKNVTQNSATGVFVDVVDRNQPQTTSNTPVVQTLQEFEGNNSPLFDGSLNQTLGYIEVPVELEYALLDKRFGINIQGGASTLFLSDNTVTVSTQGFDTEIGEANNVNNVSFSTNIGLGFNYKITEQVKFNVEPKFKYQIQTFSDSNDFNPYYLGLYTGFSFKF